MNAYVAAGAMVFSLASDATADTKQKLASAIDFVVTQYDSAHVQPATTNAQTGFVPVQGTPLDNSQNTYSLRISGSALKEAGFFDEKFPYREGVFNFTIRRFKYGEQDTTAIEVLLYHKNGRGPATDVDFPFQESASYLLTHEEVYSRVRITDDDYDTRTDSGKRGSLVTMDASDRQELFEEFLDALLNIDKKVESGVLSFPPQELNTAIDLLIKDHPLYKP